MNYPDHNAVVEVYTCIDNPIDRIRALLKTDFSDRFHNLVSASMEANDLSLKCRNGRKKATITGKLEHEPTMGRVIIGLNYSTGYAGLASVANLQSLLESTFARTTIAHIRTS